jgi:5,10-methylene-tetrahydrofolate dehydrogenase/methenyl tetrahydrofolate cyclohydrolase
MAAELIDGAALAKTIEQEVRERVAKFSRPLHLTAILVGGTSAAELYANRQANACRNVGIDYELLKLPPETG